MSPRPRTVPDEQILEATHRAMSRLGPVKLTLADVAKEAGLSPATLVQRFGSKRGLMLALWTVAVEGVDACFAMLRPAHTSPLAAVVAGATDFARATRTPEEMSNHLAFLQIDLSDPEFHRHMLELSRRTETGYRALLDEAIDKGELMPCDTRRLARAVNAISGGSLIAWAVFRDGPAEVWVRKDLETLLKPYRAAKRAEVAKRAGISRRGRKGQRG
jgi:AcrR family transcriptional regulator